MDNKQPATSKGNERDEAVWKINTDKLLGFITKNKLYIVIMQSEKTTGAQTLYALWFSISHNLSYSVGYF